MTMAERVLLGVTGCIAAYKACEVVRGLQKAGCEVEVVMTGNATRFVAPHTFSALCGRPALVDNFGDPADAIPHIRMAEECDVFLVAPCTANVAAKIASGVADDLLTTCALAAHDRLAVAPAMNVHMYESPATQRNLAVLRDREVAVVEPDSGYLACGDVGRGRLASVDDIVSATLDLMRRKGDGPDRSLAGMNVLVTAGPTIEWIDPVRFVSNPSTGKMGYAVAEEARDRGADVVLVSGPVSLPVPEGVRVVHVQTAEDMLSACRREFGRSDVAVFAAAVSDFRPKGPSPRKLKKSTDAESLACMEMVENPDVLATMAAEKAPGQFVVGFAAETDEVLRNAREKLESKGADMIVANEVGKGMGFGADGETAFLVSKDATTELPYLSKRGLAAKILDAACDNFKVC